MNVARAVLVSAVLGLFAGACGGDDDEGDPGAFPGVSEWKCYVFGTDSCECVGLGPNDDYEANGTLVTSCPATLPVCQTFKDDFDSWICECQAAAWTPSGATTTPTSAPKCPP